MQHAAMARGHAAGSPLNRIGPAHLHRHSGRVDGTGDRAVIVVTENRADMRGRHDHQVAVADGAGVDVDSGVWRIVVDVRVEREVLVPFEGGAAGAPT